MNAKFGFDCLEPEGGCKGRKQAQNLGFDRHPHKFTWSWEFEGLHIQGKGEQK